MRIRYAAKTDVGMKRNHNEDYFSLIEDEQLFLVADGMGGHASGEVASKMAADVIQEFFSRSKDEEATWPYKLDRHLSYVETRLVVGIKLANQRIFQSGSQHTNDQDIFIMCSDGLSGMVEDPKLLEVVRGAGNLEAAVSGLVDAANQAGGTDNITVLALQCLANGA